MSTPPLTKRNENTDHSIRVGSLSKELVGCPMRAGRSSGKAWRVPSPGNGANLGLGLHVWPDTGWTKAGMECLCIEEGRGQGWQFLAVDAIPKYLDTTALPAGQTVMIEVTATDRPGHKTTKTQAKS